MGTTFLAIVLVVIIFIVAIYILNKPTSGPLNRAFEHFGQIRYLVANNDEEGVKSEIIEIIRLCQEEIGINHKNGDAYILLANVYSIAPTYSNNPEFFLRLAVASIYEWNISHYYARNADNGYRLLESIKKQLAILEIQPDDLITTKDSLNRIIQRKIPEITAKFPDWHRTYINSAIDTNISSEVRRFLDISPAKEAIGAPQVSKGEAYWAGGNDEVLRDSVHNALFMREFDNVIGGRVSPVSGEMDSTDREASLPTVLDYEQTLVMARASGDRVREAKTLYYLGDLYNTQGQYAYSTSYYKQALVIVQAIGDRAGEGAVLSSLVEICMNQGQHELALSYCSQLLEIVRELGNRAAEGVTLAAIAANHVAKDQNRQALAFFKQALVIARELNDRSFEGRVLDSMGSAYNELGDYEQSLLNFRQALLLARETSDQFGEGITLASMGEVYQAQGQYERALSSHLAALVIRRDIKDRAGEGRTLYNIGKVFEGQQKFNQALSYYRQALMVIHELGDRSQEGSILNNIGAFHARQGQYDEAITYYKQALTLAREAGDHKLERLIIDNTQQITL